MKHLGVLPPFLLAAFALVAVATAPSPVSAAPSEAGPQTERSTTERSASPWRHAAYLKLQLVLTTDGLPLPAGGVLERVVEQLERAFAPGRACRRIVAAGDEVDASLVRRCRERFGEDVDPLRVCRRVANVPQANPNLTERCRIHLEENDGFAARAVCRRLLHAGAADEHPVLLERCRELLVDRAILRLPRVCQRLDTGDERLERCRAAAAALQINADDERFRA